MTCCDSWDLGDANGTCPDCGMETVDGDAVTGCSYSPIDCKTCGSATCDGSC